MAIARINFLQLAGNSHRTGFRISMRISCNTKGPSSAVKIIHKDNFTIA